MLEKTLNRIMEGAKTPEGKVIAILVTLSLALMTWNATSIKAAFATDEEDLPAASDVMADETDVAAEQEVVQEAPAAPEAPAAVEAAEPVVEPAAEAAADSEASVEPAAEEGDASQQAAEPVDDEASKEAAPAEKDGDKEKAEEIAYPAVNFDVKYVGDAAITVSAAEGVFPEGASVEFGYVDSDSVYAAVDAATDDELAGVQPVKLVFRDADGKEITPKGQVTVKVSWATPLEGNAHVFTISDSGAAEAVSGSSLVSATPEKQEFKLSAEQAVRAFAIAATTTDAENATTDDEATEEKATETERTESAETGYPAQTIIGHAGWTSVQITAPEGSLPEGAKVVVKKVDTATVADAVEAAAEAHGKSVGDMVALDVTITDKDGNEIQPLKPVSVQFVNVGVSGDDISVYHVADDKGSATEVATEKAVDVVQSFEAEGFSVYVVVATDIPRLTVKFNNESTTIATMYVKAADTAPEVDKILNDPGAGTVPTGQVFKGWTTDPNYTKATPLMTIAQVRSDAMERAAALNGADGEVTYYAAIFKQYTVTYVDGDGITVGAEVAEIPARENEATYPVNMGYTTDDKHNFEGWIVTDGESHVKNYPAGAQIETIGGETIYYYTNGTEITITGDVEFSVEAPEGYWLIFDENGKGATYNAPRFIKAGEVTSSAGLLEMVRNGYTFLGWYTGAPSATGGDPTGPVFQFGNALTETTTIYAKWQAITSAQYTVLIWKQNLAGDGYDFVEAVRPTGTVGTTPTAVNASNGRVQGAHYTGETGFSYKETDQASKTIAPEGNTVVNVYYDRNQYTLTFQAEEYTYTQSNSNSDNWYYIPLASGGYEQVYLDHHNGGGGYWTIYYSSQYSNGARYSGLKYTRSYGTTWTTIKTITALYGQSIGDNFPIEGTNGRTYDQGERWEPQNSSTYKEVLVYIDFLDRRPTPLMAARISCFTNKCPPITVSLLKPRTTLTSWASPSSVIRQIMHGVAAAQARFTATIPATCTPSTSWMEHILMAMVTQSRRPVVDNFTRSVTLLSALI